LALLCDWLETVGKWKMTNRICHLPFTNITVIKLSVSVEMSVFTDIFTDTDNLTLQSGGNQITNLVSDSKNVSNFY
jgi:hypothetical protein